MEHPSKRRRLSGEMAPPTDTSSITDPIRGPPESVGEDDLPMVDPVSSQLDGGQDDREHPIAHGRSHRHSRLLQKVVEPRDRQRDNQDTTVVATSTVSFVCIAYNLFGIDMCTF